MRYVAYAGRKKATAALKPIYTAVADNDALMALTAFADSTPGKKVPDRRRSVRERLGPVHTVPRLRPRHPQSDLHHQQHRIPELPAA